MTLNCLSRATEEGRIQKRAIVEPTPKTMAGDKEPEKEEEETEADWTDDGEQVSFEEAWQD